MSLLLLTFLACGARRPVLYPNEHVKEVGPDVAERDVDECMREAEQFAGSENRNADVARDTTIGAAGGAASGAVGGAIWGRAGRGAASGAAAGAVAGLLHGLFHRKEPSAAFMGWVSSCLRERGYEVVGWK